MRRDRGFAGGMTRQERRLGAWIALAVFLLQLVATAGHFHPEDFPAPTDVVAVAALRGDAGLSGGNLGGGLLHDDCALCFTLALAGNAPLPALAQIPLPTAETGVAALIMPAPRLVAATHRLFQTRGPPVA
jgi:hypothetical protein